MNTHSLISWNVNGIRAIQGKGFLDWMAQVSPDVLCVQESKAQPSQLDASLLAPEGYHSYWESAERKGYSGVATFTKQRPLSTRRMGIDAFDVEGRVQVLEFETYYLINAYFPNSQEKGRRIEYKVAFCDAMLALCDELRATGKDLVLCGDYNIAHKPIDLRNPEANTENPGYLPEERAWMDRFTEAGYLDTFRLFCDEPDHYTWWSYRTRARERNVGWRIDYHCVNAEAKDRVKDARILADVMGSDHCPVQITLAC
ncbi:MAG: exodeoxyribonuclease III [Chlamydiia bacterium]|nr:exodeoxyribonuclease III [Chlamydiia bacterium]